ncbi:Uncharacterised protein [Mycoplasmopsis edwardii]|uniref:Uncharacterized protein n=1 Tax=Mycoplasmopsis edwardii TaxID=53558 RepID=A0A3B0PKP9_9BACT|nr:Uncharacterised protein [Mycoplasmopsis edwardii]
MFFLSINLLNHNGLVNVVFVPLKILSSFDSGTFVNNSGSYKIAYDSFELGYFVETMSFGDQTEAKFLLKFFLKLFLIKSTDSCLLKLTSCNEIKLALLAAIISESPVTLTLFSFNESLPKFKIFQLPKTK